MTKLEKDVLRMELQIGELIRIVANLNERLQGIEEVKQKKSRIQKIPISYVVH